MSEIEGQHVAGVDVRKRRDSYLKAKCYIDTNVGAGEKGLVTWVDEECEQILRGIVVSARRRHVVVQHEAALGWRQPGEQD